MKRILVIAAVATVSLLILASLAGLYYAPRLKVEMENLLSQRSGRPVRIESFGWSLWPALQFKGSGLSIGSSDERSSLYVYVESLRIRTGFLGILTKPRSIESLILQKTLIRVPPRKNRSADQPRRVSVNLQNPRLEIASPVILEELVLETAAVEILRKEPEKPPRIIEIRRLTMKDLALGEASPFEADLRYPRPEGDVLVNGEFGPFDREEPISTPISGEYEFVDADLGTFREISGILNSEGRFGGDLRKNHIVGRAKIPDFQLAKAQNIVPLDVSFEVDRISGDIYLREVETSFLQTRLSTTGEIRGLPQGKGRVVDLEVNGTEARVEDLLRIALRGDEPPLVGQIELTTSVTVPPGPGRVFQRLIVAGEFSIEEGELTNDGFQEKLAQISKIGRSDRGESQDNRTFSDLNGEFRLEKGRIEFSRLRFGVPGMLVTLTGGYGLESEQMDFRGRVEMEKSVSEMTSGRLSEWLKVLDPILRRGDAGTSVPIKIKGTRNSPSVSLDF